MFIWKEYRDSNNNYVSKSEYEALKAEAIKQFENSYAIVEVVSESSPKGASICATTGLRNDTKQYSAPQDPSYIGYEEQVDGESRVTYRKKKA